MSSELLISVILPVFNGAETLSESIESILYQTYTNFELIIINDGSQDSSLEIIQKYKDSRIKLINQKNLGLARTLNIGILSSKGELIARQDQDDISEIYRFELQVAQFLKNQNLILLGTSGVKIDSNGKTIKPFKLPSKSGDLKFLLNFYNPFIHSSIMIKREPLFLSGLYSESTLVQPPEDYELWNRIKKYGEIKNLNMNLVRYRFSETNMTKKYFNIINHNYQRLFIEYLKNEFNLNVYIGNNLFAIFFGPRIKIPIKLRLKLLLAFLKSVFYYFATKRNLGLPSMKFIFVNSAKILIK